MKYNSSVAVVKQVQQKRACRINAVKMGLTIEEAAECTSIGRNTMRKLVDWGKLLVLKVGRKAIIRLSDEALAHLNEKVSRV